MEESLEIIFKKTVGIFFKKVRKKNPDGIPVVIKEKLWKILAEAKTVKTFLQILEGISEVTLEWFAWKTTKMIFF